MGNAWWPTARSPLPGGGRLYGPECSTKDRARGGVPDGIVSATTPMIALPQVRASLAAGVARAPVPGDAADGDQAGFRAGLRLPVVECFQQVDASTHKDGTGEVPIERQCVRRHPTADAPPSPTWAQMAAGIPAAQWRSARWKTAGGRRGSTRLASYEIWLPHAQRNAGDDLEKIRPVVDGSADAVERQPCDPAHLHRPPTKPRCLTLGRSRGYF